MSAERYIPYEAPQSLWSMIELYAPTVELPEIKYIIGEDLIEQSFELFDEIDCLLEVWRSTVPKEVPVKISGRNIPESLHVRNNVLMKIRQFIDQLDETKNHLLKGFLDDRKVICNYAIKQSSIPATAISTDGRLTPSRKLSKNHHIDTPDISAYRDSLSAFEVEKIVGDIRFSFLEEQALLRKDIDFLQDAIANEHERTSGALERQPSLCELKTFADELEQKLIDIAQPAFANVQNVKPNLPKLKSIPSNEPSSSHLSSPPLPIIPSRPQKSPNGNSSRSSWRQRTLKKVDIPVTPSNSLLRELRLKSNRSAVNKEKLLIPHPPPVRRTAFELQK